MDKKTISLVGGTGRLGTLIANALLERPGVQLRLLVRAGSRAKLADLERRGAQVVEGALGAEDAAALAALCKGAHTVVSSVQGGPDVIVEGQGRLLRAARDASVRRFIPSDFSFDFFGLGEGENINSDWRREFARRAEAERGAVQMVHVLIGAFLDKGVLFDFLGAFDLRKDEGYLWGDGEMKMEFTTYEDTAAFTAEAALDAGPLPDRLFFAGESLNFHELVRETEAGLGRPLTVKRLGTLANLDAELARRLRDEPGNRFAWLPLMYWRAMLNGKGGLGPLMNARYPGIRATGVREYVKAHLAPKGG